MFIRLCSAITLALACAFGAASQARAQTMGAAELNDLFNGAAIDELLEVLKTIVFIEQIDRSCGVFTDYRPQLPDARSALYEKFEQTVDARRDFIQAQLATSERYYRERIQPVILSGCSGANFERGVADLRARYELAVNPPGGEDPVTQEMAVQYFDQCALNSCVAEPDYAQCVRVCACSAHRSRKAMTASQFEKVLFEVKAHHIKRQSPEFDPRFKDLPPDARPKQLPPPTMEEVRAANAERDAIIAGPLLDIVQQCEADILAGYGRAG